MRIVGETESRQGEREAADLVEKGADLAGALADGALALVGGPLGTIGGAAVGVAIKHTAVAVAGRLFARQRVRAGAALALIADKAEDHRERGEEPRHDGFFGERGGLRAEAEELLEAVLLQAAKAYDFADEEQHFRTLARTADSRAEGRTRPTPALELEIDDLAAAGRNRLRRAGCSIALWGSRRHPTRTANAC